MARPSSPSVEGASVESANKFDLATRAMLFSALYWNCCDHVKILQWLAGPKRT